MADHEATGWRVHREADGWAFGTAECACGWIATRGPFDSLTEASEEVSRIWSLHLAASEEPE